MVKHPTIRASLTPHSLRLFFVISYIFEKGLKEAWSSSPGGGGVYWPAKVCYLQLSLHVQQQVLWLDVPGDIHWVTSTSTTHPRDPGTCEWLSWSDSTSGRQTSVWCTWLREVRQTCSRLINLDNPFPILSQKNQSCLKLALKVNSFSGENQQTEI